MKLGSSLRRRRSWGRRGTKDETAGEGVLDRVARPARIVGLGTATILVAFTVGYLVATRALFPAPAPPPDLLDVPALGGLALAEALGAVSEAGLTVGTVDSVRHPVTPAGIVLGQSPLPGMLALPDADVRLTVSGGPESRTIPDATGLAVERARILLESTGFTVAVVDSIEGEEPFGEVTEVDPPPGTEATLPAEVRLVISLGPPMVEMPVLLGLQQEAAVSALDSLGLTVSEIQTRFRFGLDQGTVIEQVPPAGDTIEVGSEVRLVVGRRGPRGQEQ